MCFGGKGCLWFAAGKQFFVSFFLPFVDFVDFVDFFFFFLRDGVYDIMKCFLKTICYHLCDLC